ncbi:sugar ABC transporter ATP-binding protein [Poriferisphaera sp. WC338]|uniref:sugar ABC transporter ATP-binding protein n=1 Tax=Poriferisphaera sp. WC338 TaxID=3425129 RepID=UPI003D816EE5
MADACLLEMHGIVKTFPGVRALDNVDFKLRRGEVHSLMGENGAGKSTLIKVLTGVYQHSGGNIQLDGQEVHPYSPLDAQKLGISTVYQEVNLIPELSVAENLYIGREPKRFGLINWKEIRRRAREAMLKIDLDIDVTLPVRSYSIAIQQMVAIARAIDYDAKVLVLDEPTSSLDTAEVAQLFTVMRRLRDQGMGIIFVSHFLDQIYEISDRITVLRNGGFIGEYPIEDLPRMKLISKMIGKNLDQVAAMEQQHQPRQQTDDQRLVLSGDKIGKRHLVAEIDIDIHSGEVVGLAGLLGSGRTEVARLLFGVDVPDSGSITVDGQAVAKHSPRAAIRNSIAFTPESRKDAGIVPELSIRENIILALQARRGWLRPIRRAEQQKLADHFIKALNVATPDANKPIGQLSGGNQQKIILARWLAMQPKLLMLDEPTRGIDVGAKAEIEKLISDLCSEGMALLFISSELEEVVRDSHRVIVMRDRKKVGELQGDEIQLDRIMQIIASDPQTQSTKEPAHA